MTNDERAGASRPGRRRVRNFATMFAAVLVLATIGRAIAGGDDHAWSVEDSGFDRTDADIARHLLQSVAGANEVVCAAVERAFNGGYWGSSMMLSVDASVSKEADETARWIGKEKLDPDVLDVARPALASDDACSRRVAARIAGNTQTSRLHEDLRDELQSSNVATRLAAVLALGHAEQDSALPTLQRLLEDRDRGVKLAALWGIGRLERQDSAPMLIELLESDPDAEVRRIAAWALGQLDD